MNTLKNFGWTTVTDINTQLNFDHQPQGPKHKPVPHKYAIEFFRQRLEANNIAIKAEQILVSPNTYKMIYLADVVPANEKVNPEFTFSVGFINNNDRTMAFTGIAGTRVYVNSAEFYVTQNEFKTRHINTVYELLSERVASIITWFKNYYQEQTGKIDQMKTIAVDDKMLGELILKYIRAGYILSSTNIKRIVKEFDKPKFEEFKPRTLWSLRNTTNEVFNRVKSPMFRLDAMDIFDEFSQQYLPAVEQNNEVKMVAE